MLCVVKISSSFFPSVEVTLSSVFLNKSIFSLQPARCWPFVPLHVNLTEHVIVESAVGGVLTGGGGYWFRDVRVRSLFSKSALSENALVAWCGAIWAASFSPMFAPVLCLLSKETTGEGTCFCSDSGRWFIDLGQWLTDSGHWSIDSGRWSIDRFGPLINRFGSLMNVLRVKRFRALALSANVTVSGEYCASLRCF